MEILDEVFIHYSAAGMQMCRCIKFSLIRTVIQKRATPASGTTNSPQHDDSSSVCVCLGIKLAPLNQEFRVKLSLSHTDRTLLLCQRSV